MSNCFTCGGPKTEGKGGRLYCRPCRQATSRAAQNPRTGGGVATHCINGHEYTPENTIKRTGGGRRCRVCQYVRSPEALARAAARRRAATEERRREAEEWFDWVVVYRVISSGDEMPGRPPSLAEWREIFSRLAEESTEEIARRTGVHPSTVGRYRATVTEGNNVAA